jgi:type IV secretory pathway component VirB8
MTDNLDSATAFDQQVLSADLLLAQRRMWLCIWGLLFLLGLSISVNFFQAASSDIEVLPFSVNANTGEVRLVDTSMAGLRQDTVEALDHQYISQYVIAYERYTRVQIQQDWETVKRFTCESSVLSQYEKKLDTDNDSNYFDRYGDISVIPEIDSINFFKKGSAVLPVSDSVLTGTRYYNVAFRLASDGGDAPRRYSLIVGVDFTEKTESAAKKRINPFGFCVFAYDKTSIVSTIGS